MHTLVQMSSISPTSSEKFFVLHERTSFLDARWDSRGWVGYKEFQGVRTTRVVVSERTCLSGTLRVGGCVGEREEQRHVFPRSNKTFGEARYQPTDESNER